MAKYHVNYEGNPGACRARTRPCPFGGEDSHFASKEEARIAYEEKMSDEILISPRWREKLETDSGNLILLEKTRYDSEEYVGWLREDSGEVVGMLKYAKYEGHDKYTICDIEIKEAHRNKGKAKELILTIEKNLGERLYTTGSYTPEGFAKLAKTPWNEEDPYNKPGVKFDSMRFVHDWHQLQLIR